MDNKTIAMIFNEADLSKVSNEDMHKANDVISEFVEELGSHHPEKVKMLKIKLELLLNEGVTYELAKMAVDKFINEDGTREGHWDYETTTAVKKEQGYDFNCPEWYFALNKVYSDYYSPDFSNEVYFRMACQYLKDKDAKPNKVKQAIIKILDI